MDEAGFAEAFEAVDAGEVLAELDGAVRPAMVQALHRLREAGLRLAAVTNNVAPLDTVHGSFAELAPLFDEVVQSSVEGVRKPEPEFYEIALRRLGLDAGDCVYLDDLGINLEPARTRGMVTLEVVHPAQALRGLGDLTGVELVRPNG